jgi:2-amino-4-ketopentanoate thiolase beta subunit
VTELLTKMEGLERGPAGNTSLTAAITLARGMDQDQVVVVQETEYTGAGKHHNSQLSFAREMGLMSVAATPMTACRGNRS